MKLTELFNGNKLTISFEVSPPKVYSAFKSVKTAIEEIAALSGAYIPQRFKSLVDKFGNSPEAAIKLMSNLPGILG